MALISAFTLIRTISLFHLTMAYFFFLQPAKIVDQSLVYILGEAMQMPHINNFSTPSPATAFLAVVFAFLGVSDLAAVSMSEETSRPYWANVTPIRLLFLFGLTGYTYTFKEGGMFGPKARSWTALASPGDHLKNSFVFTWGFLEMVMWFWVFITLRDERRQAGIALIEKRKKEAKTWQVKE